MPKPTAERVRKRRTVPDTRIPGFAEECRRQGQRVAEADAADPDLRGFIDTAWAELDKIAE
jgi:hypothetical protein